MTDIPIPTDAARTAPRDRECLTCYLGRMLAEFGCHHSLHWAMQWQQHNAPRATTLRRRLWERDAYCDCEVLSVVYPWTLRRATGGPLTPCAGVFRRGSLNPCRPHPARERALARPAA